MRLEVVEAPDHSACMEQLRSRYGADCVVVHSFRCLLYTSDAADD